jgi:hypothetical protein
MHKIEITHSRYLGIKEAELYTERKIDLWLFTFTFRIRKDFTRQFSDKIKEQVEAWKELYSVSDVIDLT